MPRVSVITPCYNAGAFVGAMLDSVRAQTLVDWEQLVVDDGSSDDSVEIVDQAAAAEPRVRLFRQSNAGVSRARNAGYAAASPDSDYLLFLDADDMLEPTMLERMVEHMDARPLVGLAYCQPAMVDERGELLGNQSWPGRFAPAPNRAWRVRELPPDETLTPWVSVYALAGIVPSLALLRRSVYAATPGWDEALGQPCEDTDLFLWMALKAEVHYVPRVLVNRRVHSAQSVADESHLVRQRAKLYAKWRELARRPDGPRTEVESGDRFVLRLHFANGLRDAASYLRAGRLNRAVRHAGGAVRRYAWPLLRRRGLGAEATA